MIPSFNATPVPQRFFNVVARAVSASRASGTPVMVVTVLPPRPLLSRRTRAMPSPSGIRVVLQVHASTGWRQSGQCRPASVENTRPPRAAKDAAFLATGNPLGRTKTDRWDNRPRSPTQAGAAHFTAGIQPTVGARLLAKVVNDNAGIQAARVALTFFASKLAPTG